MAKQVVKDEPKQLVMPGFMAGEIGLGTEKLSASDCEVPRIKLMQALSPELVEYDIRAGNFWHTLAEENMGSEVRISPIFIDVRFILWRPRKSGGGILARADDGQHWSPPNGEFAVKLDNGKEVIWKTAPTIEQSRLAEWGSMDPSDTNSPPAATRMYSVVATFPDHPGLPPAVVTLQRSQIKVARRFIGKLKITRAPSFGLIFNMVSVEDTNAAGQKFYNFAFKADGMIQDLPTYERNRDFYAYFKSQGVSIKDLEGAQGDESEIPEDKAAF